MCRTTTCRKCNKPTWAGCGMHVEQALSGVPKEQRCKCREEARSEDSKPGFLERLFGSRR